MRIFGDLLQIGYGNSKTDQALLLTLNKLTFLMSIMAERNVVLSQNHAHLQAFALLMPTAATSQSLHLCACTQGCTMSTIGLLMQKLALDSSFQLLLFSSCKVCLIATCI